jgi:hypothetical protein
VVLPKPGLLSVIFWTLVTLLPAGVGAASLWQDTVPRAGRLRQHRPPAQTTEPPVVVQGKVTQISAPSSPQGRSCAAWTAWVEVQRKRTKSKGGTYLATERLCAHSNAGDFSIEAPEQPTLRYIRAAASPRVWVEGHRQERAHDPAFQCKELRPGESALDVEACLQEGDLIGGYACQSGAQRQLTICADGFDRLTSPPGEDAWTDLRKGAAFGLLMLSLWLCVGVLLLSGTPEQFLLNLRQPPAKKAEA